LFFSLNPNTAKTAKSGKSKHENSEIQTTKKLGLLIEEK
jgi:hypothetical protein